MNANHQLSKRDLIALLEPFDDSDRVEVSYKDHDGDRLRLFIDRATPCADRCAVVLQAYEN